MRQNLKAARQSKGLTQQQVADYLNITLRYYQKLEAGESNGSFGVWDALEELLKIHQRTLRESSNKNLDQVENLLEHLRNQLEQSMN